MTKRKLRDCEGQKLMFGMDKKKSNKRKVYCIDWGNNSATIYGGEGSDTIEGLKEAKAKTISKQDLLNLPFTLEPGSLVLAEGAHFYPQNALSLARPFTEKQLLKLFKDFKDAGIEFKLFSEKLTPRALRHLQKVLGLEKKTEKSDSIDPVAHWVLLRDHPEITLKKTETISSFEKSPIRSEGYLWKEEANKVLNVTRTRNYKDPNNANVQWLAEHVEEILERLPAEYLNYFFDEKNLRYKQDAKNGEGYKIGDLKPTSIRYAQIHSVLAQLRGKAVKDEDGTYVVVGDLRLRESTGEFPGWHFVKEYAIGMSPFHHRGGIARSNFYKHGTENFVKRRGKAENERRGKEAEKLPPFKGNRGAFNDDQDAFFKVEQKICSKAIHALFQLLKDLLLGNDEAASQKRRADKTPKKISF